MGVMSPRFGGRGQAMTMQREPRGVRQHSAEQKGELSHPIHLSRREGGDAMGGLPLLSKKLHGLEEVTLCTFQTQISVGTASQPL